jgi:hypothetical protein
MQPTSSNIFHTSLAFHPSSLTARTSTRAGNKGVGKQWYFATGFRYGTIGMEASSWGVVSPESYRIP